MIVLSDSLISRVATAAKKATANVVFFHNEALRVATPSDVVSFK